MTTRRIARAKSASDRGDYAEAVLNYKEVLDLDHDNLQALQGLYESAELERQMTAIRSAFQHQDYASALRRLYRLPESLHLADRYKVNGWYNLGVVALRAGRCDEAVKDFYEALEIQSDNQGIVQSLGFAERCRTLTKNWEYYQAVESMRFRGLDD